MDKKFVNFMAMPEISSNNTALKAKLIKFVMFLKFLKYLLNFTTPQE